MSLPKTLKLDWLKPLLQGPFMTSEKVKAAVSFANLTAPLVTGFILRHLDWF